MPQNCGSTGAETWPALPLLQARHLLDGRFCWTWLYADAGVVSVTPGLIAAYESTNPLLWIILGQYGGGRVRLAYLFVAGRTSTYTDVE